MRACEEHARRLEADVHVPDVAQTAHEQAAPHEQHAAHRHLPDEDRTTQAQAIARSGPVLDRRDDVETRGAARRRQPEYDRGQGGQAQRVEQHGAIDLQIEPDGHGQLARREIERSREPDRHQHAGRSARQRQQQALGE